jgi:hypothetical protein
LTGPGESVLVEAPMSLRWADFRYRLVTLLEIMKKIDAGELFETSAVMLWHQVYRDVSGHGYSVELIEKHIRSDEGKNVLLPQLLRSFLLCERADLPVSKIAAGQLLNRIHGGQIELDELQQGCRTVRERIRDELKSRTFLLIETSKSSLYENATEGWEEIVKHFPSSQRDVEEASKCLALDRPTACVFHLMRVLEPALGAIAKALGVQKQSPAWNAYLTAFRAAYTAKFVAKTAADKDSIAFYSGLEAHLTAIKDAWRNPTMHAVETSYSESEALDIYRAVGAFMRKVSTQLSE